MSEPTPPPSEAQQQAEIKKHARARDFKAVFGLKGKRTDAQQRVLDYLEGGGDDANSYDFNSNRDGMAILWAGVHRDGAKSIIRIINRNLSIAENMGTPPKVKPTIKR